ncbi:hypothetical protein HDU96_003727, partial [Phlyctochytrium bullatum]
MAIYFITLETLLEICLYLNPNDIPAFAATCKFLRSNLSLQSLSFPFAKKHLELFARLELGKLLVPWDDAWLHDLRNNVHVKYHEPLLFNYGLAAVALHGLTFSEKRSLANLMLEWDFESSDA